MYRKFKLTNASGQEYDLTDKMTKVVFVDPKGLGFNKEIAYEEFSHSVSVINQKYNMPAVTGDVVFYGDTQEKIYQDYYEFSNFIANSPLNLRYITPNTSTSYELSCIVTQLTKEEINKEDGMLHCPITFTGLSLWKRSEYSELIMQKITGEAGKYYDLERDYYYASDQFNDVIVNIAADITIPFELLIDGQCTDPCVTFSKLITSDGVTSKKDYGIVAFKGTFDSVYINTSDIDEYVKLTNGNQVYTNPYNYQDYNNSKLDGVIKFNFFDLLIGQNVVNFGCENLNTFNGSVILRWKDLRATM